MQQPQPQQPPPRREMFSEASARVRSSSSGRPSPSVPAAPPTVSYHPAFSYGVAASPQATSSTTPRVPSPGRVVSSSAANLHRPVSSPSLSPAAHPTAHAAQGAAAATMSAAQQPAPARGRVYAAPSNPIIMQHPHHGRVISANMVGATATSQLQTEVAMRQRAEARVRELEALVSRMRGRIAALEGKGRNGTPRRRLQSPKAGEKEKAGEKASISPKNLVAEKPPPVVEEENDAIDNAICKYLERNPDFPVPIQKVAPNAYIFGDRGTVNVTQVGEHIVVRVGGGFKSLQVFMDERALMVSTESNMRTSPRAAS